tara:strand:+ start:9272 stop:9742 length:471 start_codon:yes stop_codon:yes gene_type:complete
MATFTSAQAAASYPVYSGVCPPGVVQRIYGTLEITANPTAADIYEMVKLPSGATVIGGHIQASDLDTGTETLDLDIGWAANGSDAADPDGFGNLGVLTGDVSVHTPVAGIYVPLAGVLQTTGVQAFAAETTIQLVCNVTAATGGTGFLTVVVDFVM